MALSHAPRSNPRPTTRVPRAPDSPPPSSRASGRESPFGVGEVLGRRYDLLTLLGAGGMGTVWEALDRVLDRRVAVKITSADARERLVAEARALAAVRHAGVPSVYDVGLHQGVPYMVMERLHGKDLQARLDAAREADRPLSILEAVEHASRIADVLGAIHSHGLIHRDLKPSNVMLATGDRTVLVDFGLARPEVGLRGKPKIEGTPHYIAPEVIEGCVMTPAVDLYSLGIMLHEMLTGAPPYESSNLNILLTSHLTGKIPSLLAIRPEVPPPLASISAELLARDPEERPLADDAARRLATLASRLRATRDVENANILVVDDDEAILRMLSAWLRKRMPTLEIRTATRGDEALRAMQLRVPDVLVLDLNMPGTNGIELCMHLRGMHLAKESLILPISAGAQPADLELLRQLGVTRFEPKGSRLGERVERHVREQLVRRGDSLPRLSMVPPCARPGA